MSEKLNLSDMLDFSEMDLTAPDKVVEEILVQLPESTQGFISGAIVEYDGPVTSYVESHMTIAQVVGSIGKDKEVNIQESLGKEGEEDKKYQCYLYTSEYTGYKYRLFFMKYGIAHYPVQFTLEESIARSLKISNYIVTCNKREEVETLIYNIITSPKVREVMQELIRINRAKKAEQ